MNALFFPKSCAEFINTNEECHALITVTHNELSKYILLDDMNHINQLTEAAFDALDSVTVNDQRLVNLINNVDALSETELTIRLESAADICEKLIILHRLCDISYQKYVSNVNQLLNIVTKRDDIKDDPYMTYIIFDFLMMGPLNFDKIQDVAKLIVQEYQETALIATEIVTRHIIFRSRGDMDFASYTNTILGIDNYMNIVANGTDININLLRSSVSYITFVANNNDVTRLRDIITWVDTHKEEVVNYNSLGNINQCIPLLIILHHINRCIITPLELSDDNWNDVERAIIFGEDITSILEKDYPLFTDDNSLYTDMHYWYSMSMGNIAE